MSRPRGDIAWDGIVFGYEPGAPVLEDFSLRVPAGNYLAVMGPSGVGKSTLLSLLLRLYAPDRGRVLVDGEDLRRYTLASWRNHFAVVLQDTLLFAGSIADNIRFGATGPVTQDQIEHAARLANIHDFVRTLPRGYETAVGERGVTMSTGQRQRIAIARAAIRNAPVLILDEPLAGLDSDTARDVLAALRRLAAGRTTIHVTHDLSCGAAADQVLYVDAGGAVHQGSHVELLEKSPAYAAVQRRDRTRHAS